MDDNHIDLAAEMELGSRTGDKASCERWTCIEDGRAYMVEPS
jgi:hypothetical protein